MQASFVVLLPDQATTAAYQGVNSLIFCLHGTSFGAVGTWILLKALPGHWGAHART